jgi:DNA-binding Xre family transcriptional regulator
MFLLDRARKRPRQFSLLHPEIVSSAAAVRELVARATKETLWVSYERVLTDALVRAAFGPSRSLGKAVFIHSLSPQSIPALTGCFQRLAFASHDNGFLAPDELAEALLASNPADLFIGGSVDTRNGSVTLWRANLEPLTVPFSAFEKSGDGSTPDFSRFAVADFGQTVRLGAYEAAADAILYEFDPEYRRRIGKERQQSERSFGASVRRLRKQRGLRREDFQPDVTAKTIARIEQGKVARIHRKTLAALAQRLQVKPDEIETY